MTKPLIGAALALLLIQSAALAQESAPCAADPLEQITVWRGSALSIETAPAEEACLSVAEAALGMDRVLAGAEWGAPALDEIASLVLSSPVLSRRVLERTPSLEELPIVERGAGATSARGTRAVLIAPGGEGAGERIVHLVILEASPDLLDVAIRSEEAGLTRLTWTRTPESPEWSEAGPRAL